MKLKEVDLDVPKRSREERHLFRLRVRSMCAHFERRLPRIDAAGWKILVECVDTVRRREVRNLLGVLVVETRADVDHLMRVDGDELNRCALDLLETGISSVAAQMGLSMDPFSSARAAVLREQFVNEWMWKTRKASPDRKHRAVVRCKHGMDRFQGWLSIEDRSGRELVRALAVDELPDEFIFKPKLGKLVWESRDAVVLSDSFGKEVCRLRVPPRA